MRRLCVVAFFFFASHQYNSSIEMSVHRVGKSQWLFFYMHFDSLESIWLHCNYVQSWERAGLLHRLWHAHIWITEFFFFFFAVHSSCKNHSFFIHFFLSMDSITDRWLTLFWIRRIKYWRKKKCRNRLGHMFVHG